MPASPSGPGECGVVGAKFGDCPGGLVDASRACGHDLRSTGGTEDGVEGLAASGSVGLY
jgi:hypothetical protein